MVHRGLHENGVRAILSGNIGGSLLDHLDELADHSVIVLELSSAMLYWMDRVNMWSRWQADVGCVTNCSPNHIDWHGDLDHYEQSKKYMIDAVREEGVLVLGGPIGEWGEGVQGSRVIVGDADAIDGCQAPGTHNAINAAMAVACIRGIGDVSDQDAIDSIRQFLGLPHRLERIAIDGRVVFYNDSKSTVPDATVLAIDALSATFQERQIHLIVGGYNKGSDLSSIVERSKTIAGVYAIGETGASLVQPSSDHMFECGTLDRAMALIHSRLNPGDAVLLSPGCASWDQFPNYEARGDKFADLARKMMTCATTES